MLVNKGLGFLLEHGYINFGFAPAVKEAQMVLHERADRASVVVVGAGLAVLVAARQLVAMGFKVVVLEGRARPGGRVKARKIKGDEWWLQQMLVGVFLLESMGTRLEFLQGNWVYHVIRLEIFALCIYLMGRLLIQRLILG